MMQPTELAADNQGYRALNAEQVASFWENGFLSLGQILDDDLIAQLRSEYDREFGLGRTGQRPVRNLAANQRNNGETDAEHHDNGDNQQQMLQFMQVSEHNIHFHRLLYHERILDAIEDILGPNIQLFHDQALYKPAHHGGPVFWHQDNAYWQCRPANLVSCWLTLDDVERENGAMQFISGSHLRPMDHERAQGSDVLLDMGNQTDDSQAVVLNLPAGGASLHHCQTLHRTAPNTTDRQRRAFAIHYMTPGTRSGRTGELLGVSFSHPLVRIRI